jgi:chromosome segregation ATPase
MDKLLANISIAEVVQALVSLLGAAVSAYLGYQYSIRQIREQSKPQIVQAARTAEQEFRDDLIKQLEEANKRLDSQMDRMDNREKKNAELIKDIDRLWEERVELKTRIASLEAELFASKKKIQDLMTELEKFERKVFYIAKPEQMKEGT